MFKTRKGLLVIIILLCFSGLINLNSIKNYFIKDAPLITRDVNITQKRQNHILYGDDHGGGHLYGMGKPCKSEFPKDWDKYKIIENVKILAANDNLNWKEQRNGYFVAESSVENLRLRVVLDKEKDDVITAYPVNVTRNPCNIQKPANDNWND